MDSAKKGFFDLTAETKTSACKSFSVEFFELWKECWSTEAVGDENDCLMTFISEIRGHWVIRKLLVLIILCVEHLKALNEAQNTTRECCRTSTIAYWLKHFSPSLLKQISQIVSSCVSLGANWKTFFFINQPEIRMVGGEEGLNNVCLPVFPCSRRKVYPTSVTKKIN